MFKFEPILTQEQYDKWQAFAAEFIPKVGNEMPIITVSKGDKMFGHYHVFNHPVIIPAFHPEKCSPKDFRDAVEIVTHHFCMNSISQQYPNGVAYVGLHNRPMNVSEKQLDKLGFENQDILIYRRLP
jgi:hypothetical protein